MLLNGPAVHGATPLWKGPNAAVYFGLPFTSLEFEKLLSGTEMVLSHKVLDWRDANFAWGPPPWYDDWRVSNPGQIDGNANEIYLRTTNHSAWTTTTVPSTIVSIHLNSDDNGGLAEVLVDGVTVAWLDMYTPVCCQTVLILVTGLSNTTHTVTVQGMGAGQGGPFADDVNIMGAAALAESDVKWNQPPLPAAEAGKRIHTTESPVRDGRTFQTRLLDRLKASDKPDKHPFEGTYNSALAQGLQPLDLPIGHPKNSSGADTQIRFCINTTGLRTGQV